MRQEHRAGEKMFIDFAGKTIPVINPSTGEVTDAQIFVAVLGASNYTYAEALPSQNLPCWIRAHIRAFEYFDGVSEILIPDNLGSGVTKACRYEPDLNPVYLRLAQQYGTIACRLQYIRAVRLYSNQRYKPLHLADQHNLLPFDNFGSSHCFPKTKAPSHKHHDFRMNPNTTLPRNKEHWKAHRKHACLLPSQPNIQNHRHWQHQRDSQKQDQQMDTHVKKQLR